MFANQGINMHMDSRVCLLYILLCCTKCNIVTSLATNTSKIPLYIGGYFRFGGSWDNSGMLPAVDLALEEINESEDILRNYDLRMVWNDTMCEAGQGTRVLFHQLFHEPQKLLNIGGGCAVATVPIAETSHHWNLITMSHGSSSPVLSNRKRFPYFYRTIMPETTYNPVRVKIIQYFGWKRVATVQGNEEVFSLTVDNLRNLLAKANISIITSETVADNPENQVLNLKEQDARVIIMDAYAGKAAAVLCEAYKLGITGEGYAWLILGWYGKKWWHKQDGYAGCTEEEIKEAVESTLYIGTDMVQLRPNTKMNIAGITSKEYVDKVRYKLTLPKYADCSWNDYASFGYDAAWAVALMFNKSVEELKTQTFLDGRQRRLEDFTYNDREMTEMFLGILNQTSFEGITGPVNFVNGDRIGLIDVEQLQEVCDESWHIHNGSCFKFVNQSKSFDIASMHCQNRSSYIAPVYDITELNFLRASFSLEMYNISEWFIGLKLNTDGIWQAQTSESVSWIPHGSDLSNGESGDEKCVVMDMMNGGIWRARNCQAQMPFICRKRAEFAEKKIAIFDPSMKEELQLEWLANVTWPGGNIPLDHTPIPVITIFRQHLGINLRLFCIMSAVAVFGELLAIMFLIFNVKYRLQRTIKMSSPNMNSLILVGSILVYMSIIAAGVDSHLVASQDIRRNLCMIWVWLLSIGFVIAFGSMFSKTWRVHKVAAFKTPKRVIVTDKDLFLLVLILLTIDVAVLITWQIIDPMDIEIQELSIKDDPMVPSQRIFQYTEQCSCSYMLYWLITLCGYKGLLLIFGAFLAWEIRKVKITALNDSKLIALSIYNITILCIVGVAVSFLIAGDPAVLYTFTSSIVVFCTSVTLLIVFLPKMMSVRKYSEGEPSSSIHKSNISISDTSTATSDLSDLNKIIAQLKDQVQRLETLLRAKDDQFGNNV